MVIVGIRHHSLIIIINEGAPRYLKHLSDVFFLWKALNKSNLAFHLLCERYKSQASIIRMPYVQHTCIVVLVTYFSCVDVSCSSGSLRGIIAI